MVSKRTQSAFLRLLKQIFGAEVPAELGDCNLFETIDTDYDPPTFFVCGDFQLVDDPQTALENWFGDAAHKAGEQLRIFLIDGNTALYAFWHQGQPLAAAPIVYLDDEGVENSVVANNLREFFSLLAAGFERISPEAIAYAIAHPGEHEPVDVSGCPLFAALGIEAAPDPLLGVQQARAAHPDFAAWVAGLFV